MISKFLNLEPEKRERILNAALVYRYCNSRAYVRLGCKFDARFVC